MKSERDICSAWANYLGGQENDPAVIALAAKSRIRSVRSGDHIIDQNDISDNIYLVRSGQLAALRYTRNGHEILLSEIGQGELVGEMSVFANAVRSSAVVANTDSQLVAVSGSDFKSLSTAHADISFAVASELARRLISTSTVLADLVSMSVPNRLYGELVREGRPIPEDDEILIVAPLPAVTTLAQRIHATREATSRAMSLLQKRGLVRRTKEFIEIVATG